MKTDSEFAILPFNTARINDKFLVSTQLGNWSLLNRDDFFRLNSFNFSPGTSLYNRLKKDGVLVTKSNLENIIRDFRSLHRNWFLDPGLHIIVLTSDCNFKCAYCQAKKTLPGRMSKEVAIKILEFIFSCRNPGIMIEFQGGEPLLDKENLKYIIENARRKNKIEKKSLEISVVTNLSLMDDETADLLIRNDVLICTSLDGPEFLHDKSRVFKSGVGTYKSVIAQIKKLQKRYRELNSTRRVGALPTITKFSLPYHKEIVDEYLSLGINGIHLRPLNRIGSADSQWDKVGLTPEEFNDFWARSMDYIIELNKRGVRVSEALSVIALNKILKKRDLCYTDLESPCGGGRTQIDYLFNGDVYTCDEARMLGDKTFKMGNLLKDNFRKIMSSENLFYSCQSSLLELWDYNSAFSPWTGTCPVFNYFEQKNPVAKIAQTAKHKIHNFQFKYLFAKIDRDREALKIFRNWVND